MQAQEKHRNHSQAIKSSGSGPPNIDEEKRLKLEQDEKQKEFLDSRKVRFSYLNLKMINLHATFFLFKRVTYPCITDRVCEWLLR